MNLFSVLKIRWAALVFALTLLLSGGTPDTPQPGEAVQALQAVLPLSQTSVTDQCDAVAAAYPKLFDHAAFGAVIPGLDQGFVPQGLGYSDALSAYLISGYFSNGDLPSAFVIVDAVSGKARKTLIFGDADGEAQTGHFGGVAAHGAYIYAVCKTQLFVYDAGAALAARGGTVLPAMLVTELPVQGSFCGAGGGVLWVGSFENRAPSEPSADPAEAAPADVPDPQGDMVGYRFSSFGPYGLCDPETPEYAAKIPALVQGVACYGRGTFVFSCSYGRTRNSRLLVFRNRNPKTWNGEAVFSKEEASRTLTAPPMSEGLTTCPAGLAILFESGAALYRTDGGKNPLDRLVTVGWLALLNPNVF
ncbi:MAG: hypothetical protein IJL52_00015 [Clostridia bacterium]|nr:hypothetical protein [Clostridia bacterium]